jgi:hypothetical protein
MFSIARLPFCGVRNASRIMSPQTQPKIVSQSGVEPLRICFALQNVDIEEFGHTGLPSRSSREKGSKSKKMSAFAKATARQSSLFSATRAKTGGKGIRTPDFQLAKLALYQLSYAPRGSFEFRLPIFDCKEENKSPDVDVIYRASGIFVMAKLRWCASKANRFCSFIVPREVPPNTPLRRR